jgi:hypothetical protein
MWMVQFDSAAVTRGVSDHLTGAVQNLVSTNSADTSEGDHELQQSVEKFDQLHHFSYPRYRTVWREEHPSVNYKTTWRMAKFSHLLVHVADYNLWYRSFDGYRLVRPQRWRDRP